VSPNAPITEESLKFDNNQSRKYFEQEFRDYGGGGKYLVAKSFYTGGNGKQKIWKKTMLKFASN
jgi:hypothetical protein